MAIKIEMRQCIAVIDIEGEIIDSDSIIDLIDEYSEKKSVKAIVLRINSPGGVAAACEEIYGELRKVEKPLIASIGNYGASGGYQIACAAKTIFANATSITGSIGVIFSFHQWQKLTEKIGVDRKVITSGEFKDIGNSFRSVTAAEENLLQSMVNECHKYFIDVVYESRKNFLTREEVEKNTDGRLLTGMQAKKANLIDTIGSLSDAIDFASEVAIKGDIIRSSEKLMDKKR